MTREDPTERPPPCGGGSLGKISGLLMKSAHMSVSRNGWVASPVEVEKEVRAARISSGFKVPISAS